MDLPLLALFLFISLLLWLSLRSSKLPPGPWGFPLIGHLHLLYNKPLQKAFQSISHKFGPIIHLRIGMIPTVVISSPELVKEVLTTHDITLASRPYFVAGEYVEYDFVALASSPYGEHYRGIRKLCTTELFTSRCIDSFGWTRKWELNYLLESVLACCMQNEAVNLRSVLTVFTFNAMTQIVCSKRYFGTGSDVDPNAREFKGLLNHMSDLVFEPSWSALVPGYLRWLDWKIPYYKEVQAKVDRFLQKIVDEHRSSSRECRDFVDMFMGHFGQGAKEDIYTKATLIDLLFAGTDTSATASEWMLAALMHNPRVMNKAQEELDKVVGSSRMVRESDFSKLEYLSAVFKETMRHFPPSTLLIPRLATKDVNVGGYKVPKGTTLIVNAWALGMDANFWKNPEEFRPERFLESTIDFKGQDYEFLPFGSGRRKCPGWALGVRTVQLLVANLIHGFDWKFDTSAPPPMEEAFSAVSRLKTPLSAMATPRLPKEAYTNLE